MPHPNPSQAATSNPSSSTRGGGRKIDVKLDWGFAWDQESLALICHWKDWAKKGALAAVESGEFPGKTQEDLDDVWKKRRQEAREAYAELKKE